MPAPQCKCDLQVSGKSLPDTAKDECASVGFMLTEKQMSTFALGDLSTSNVRLS